MPRWAFEIRVFDRFFVDFLAIFLVFAQFFSGFRRFPAYFPGFGGLGCLSIGHHRSNSGRYLSVHAVVTCLEVAYEQDPLITYHIFLISLPIGHHSCAWYTDLVRSSSSTSVSGITSWAATVQIGSSPTTSGPWITNSYIHRDSMNAELGTEVDEECPCFT